MTVDEWVEACLATAPPFSPAQEAILRQLWRPATPKTVNAAPAANEGRAQPHKPQLPGRSMTDARS